MKYKSILNIWTHVFVDYSPSQETYLKKTVNINNQSSKNAPNYLY